MRKLEHKHEMPGATELLEGGGLMGVSHPKTGSALAVVGGGGRQQQRWCQLQQAGGSLSQITPWEQEADRQAKRTGKKAEAALPAMDHCRM